MRVKGLGVSAEGLGFTVYVTVCIPERVRPRSVKDTFPVASLVAVSVPARGVGVSANGSANGSNLGPGLTTKHINSSLYPCTSKGGCARRCECAWDTVWALGFEDWESGV